jgi:hypothetical protein
MTTGTDIEEELSEVSSTADVDKIIWKHVKAGHVPDYIAEDYWKEVVIKENGHELKLLVAPDYFAVGTDDDPFRVGKETPMLAQKVADHYDSILPSTKILRKIQEQASPKWSYTDVKSAPYNIPLAKIETHQALVAANNLANKLFEKAGIDPGEEDETQIGYRKAIVVGPDLDGSRVAIYGGRWSAAGNIVQPYSTIHEAEYSDYSHGLVLVSRKAELDGEWVDLRDDVFGDKNPAIHGLVIDLTAAPGVGKAQKRFDPVFPNSGKGSLARFSVGTPSGSSSTTTPSSTTKTEPSNSSSVSIVEASSKKRPLIIAAAVTGIAVVVLALT